MNSDPILEEVWRIKDELAREAGYDLHRLCENTRRWAAEHPHPGPQIEDAAALRHFVEQQENAAAALREQPPPYGEESGEKP